MNKENPLIRNCHFKFKCEKKWETLLVINDYHDRRFCNSCQKDVHLVESISDLRKALEFDLCVAVPLREDDPMWEADSGAGAHLLGYLDNTGAND
jgi:hypothetical protein